MPRQTGRRDATRKRRGGEPEVRQWDEEITCALIRAAERFAYHQEQSRRLSRVVLLQFGEFQERLRRRMGVQLELVELGGGAGAREAGDRKTGEQRQSQELLISQAKKN